MLTKSFNSLLNQRWLSIRASLVNIISIILSIKLCITLCVILGIKLINV